jgi:hypothetical protein
MMLAMVAMLRFVRWASVHIVFVYRQDISDRRHRCGTISLSWTLRNNTLNVPQE